MTRNQSALTEKIDPVYPLPLVLATAIIIELLLLLALLDFVREGDTVMVHSVDRLARNLDDLRRLVQQLTGRRAKIQFVKENLFFTGNNSPMSSLLLSVMGVFTEFKPALIKERQREGIMLAK